MTRSLRGREAEARRNDARILEAALVILSRDPRAPMSAVARGAGVGQATLYRRYPTKEALLVKVCEHGIDRIGQAVRTALEAPDAWAALGDFLVWHASSGALRMGALLGTFNPPAALIENAHRANVDMQTLVHRAVASGRLRADITGADLTLLATQIAALDADGTARTEELRRRYIGLALQGLALTNAPALPGPAPDAAELERPWRDDA